METVSELMTPDPVVVPVIALLPVAARKMIRLSIRHLPVVDAGGALVGVVSDHAVFSRGGLVGPHEELWLPFDEADERLTCGEVAVPVEVVATADEPLRAVLCRLVASPQDVAVVVDGARHPVGVVTEHDGVRLAAGALANLPARRIGSQVVRAVRRDDPAARAIEVMRTRAIRHVLVTEPDGRLFGVLSFSDLIADAAWGREITAEEVVRRGQLVVARGAPGLREVAALMARHKVGCVPILDDDDRPIAVVTRSDVIDAYVRTLDAEPPLG